MPALEFSNPLEEGTKSRRPLQGRGGKDKYIVLLSLKAGQLVMHKQTLVLLSTVRCKDSIYVCACGGDLFCSLCRNLHLSKCLIRYMCSAGVGGYSTSQQWSVLQDQVLHRRVQVKQ